MEAEYMMVMTSSGNYAREFDEEAAEVFLAEGTPVVLFNDEQDIEGKFDYTWVEAE